VMAGYHSATRLKTPVLVRSRVDAHGWVADGDVCGPWMGEPTFERFAVSDGSSWWRLSCTCDDLLVFAVSFVIFVPESGIPCDGCIACPIAWF
jgi:hypothetical protein